MLSPTAYGGLLLRSGIPNIGRPFVVVVVVVVVVCFCLVFIFCANTRDFPFEVIIMPLCSFSVRELDVESELELS